MIAWYCVVSRPQQEARASSELTNQGFKTFLPTLDAKPMFPRYLFAAFDRDRDNWGIIKSTRGCVDLLKSNFIPTPVPNYAMDLIMTYKPPWEPQEVATAFSQGQSVEIHTGPLQGLRGLFVENSKVRTMAFLEIMGKRVKLPRNSMRIA